GAVGPRLYLDLFSRFAWGHVQLAGGWWRPLVQLLGIAGVAGCLLWLVRSRRALATPYRLPLLFLGLAGLVVWASAVLRPLPTLLEAQARLSAVRYTFPAIIPTVLVLAGGWLALWPRRYRVLGILALVLGMAAVNLVAVATIRAYYHPAGI
ncbi:MAG TPA: hypothetical protein VER55_00530, partial [Ardenticatenaceae bacterium]|nr:hypothetical protein [Ardenticatenaceae bacterium]